MYSPNMHISSMKKKLFGVKIPLPLLVVMYVHSLGEVVDASMVVVVIIVVVPMTVWGGNCREDV